MAALAQWLNHSGRPPASVAWTIDHTAEAERDLGLILDHLFQSYRDVGEAGSDAFDRAARQVRSIKAAGDAIATAPHRGTRHDDILPGLRHVAIDRAVTWFELYEPRQTVRILAIFFGGQDRLRHMPVRLPGD